MRFNIIHIELKAKYPSVRFTKTKDSRSGSLCWLIEYLIMRVMSFVEFALMEIGDQFPIW